jgi:release factor glutamine methyltransferase
MALASRLAKAGCVAPDEEAEELLTAAGARADANGEDYDYMLERLVSRRESGEPLAWVTGFATFLGHRVVVHPGVYVPRWQSEALALRAIELLPEHGLAADLCTGCGAIAVALSAARPRARVVATDIDALACHCAAENGVEVFTGHLAEPLPGDLRGHFDVVIGVVPYVPSDEIVFLPRDVREYEPLLALDGGPGGTRVLEQAVWAGAELLSCGGTLLLEVGGDQAEMLSGVLSGAGFGTLQMYRDEDGDLRGLQARRL